MSNPNPKLQGGQASRQLTGQVPVNPVRSGTVRDISEPDGTVLLLLKALSLVEVEKREGPFYGPWNTALYSLIFRYDPNEPSIIPLICPQFPLVLNLDTIPDAPTPPTPGISPVLFPVPPARPETPVRQGPLPAPDGDAYHQQRKAEADVHSPDDRRIFVSPRNAPGTSPVHIPYWFEEGYERHRHARIPDFVVFLCSEFGPSKRLSFILEAKRPIEDVSESNLDRVRSIFLEIESQVADQALHAFRRTEQDCHSTIGVMTCAGKLWRYFELTEADISDSEIPSIDDWPDASYEEHSTSNSNCTLRQPPKPLERFFDQGKFLTLQDMSESVEAFQAIRNRMIGLTKMA